MSKITPIFRNIFPITTQQLYRDKTLSKKSKYPLGIRLATVDDIDTIVKIEQNCFPGETAYSKRQLTYFVSKAHSTCLVETQGNIMRGFVIVTYRAGSTTGSIETIDVELTFQSEGVGSKLLEAAEADMKQNGMKYAELEVSEGNFVALRLYEKAGYSLKEKISNYYHYNHNGTKDAVRMVKIL